MNVILGSSSPRRKTILSYFKIPFVCATPNFDESTIPFEGDPIAYSKELSYQKALSLVSQYPDQIIISADTVVCFENNIFHKPKDVASAEQMLNTLSGTTHQVITAVSVCKNNKCLSDYAETEITFIDIPQNRIKSYIVAFSTLDKCGSYSIQDGGSLIIKNIVGCSYNVQGLPINTLYQLLLQFNIDLWDFLV